MEYTEPNNNQTEANELKIVQMNENDHYFLQTTKLPVHMGRELQVILCHNRACFPFAFCPRLGADRTYIVRAGDYMILFDGSAFII